MARTVHTGGGVGMGEMYMGESWRIPTTESVFKNLD